MNMNAAGIIDPCTSGSELSHKLLYCFNIFILTNRRNKFHGIITACRTVTSVTASDGGVAHQFPLTVAGISDRIGVIPATHMRCLRTEMPCYNPCCRCSCKTRHLNFDTEVLASQTESPSVRFETLTAEESAAFGFRDFSAGFGTVPDFISMNSRTPAGTVLV